jgi:seryl-tRNA synthetase
VIDDNTKITVWKLKSAEQAEKDRQEAQAEINKLQKENSALQTELSACGGAGPAMMAAANESEACKTARARANEIMNDMMKANQKMDMYEKIANAKLSDIKSGWNIMVTAELKKDGGKDAPVAGPAMMNQYENIASVQKLSASSIEAREAQSMPRAPMGVPAMP